MDNIFPNPYHQKNIHMLTLILYSNLACVEVTSNCSTCSMTNNVYKCAGCLAGYGLTQTDTCQGDYKMLTSLSDILERVALSFDET